MYRYVISVQICYLQSVQFTSVQILDSVYKYVSCDGRCIIKKVQAEYSLLEKMFLCLVVLVLSAL